MLLRSSVLLLRAVGRSENPGVPVLFGGHNLSPLVEIGLTDLPKSGGAPPGTTGLLSSELFLYYWRQCNGPTWALTPPTPLVPPALIYRKGGGKVEVRK